MTLSTEEQIEKGRKELEKYVYLEEVENLLAYNWPIDEGQRKKARPEDDDDTSGEDDDSSPTEVYRKITNFSICDVFGVRLKSFYINETDPSKYFLLVGDLLPENSESNTQATAVKIPVVDIFYNFGVSANSSYLKRDHRLESGFWARDYNSVLYLIVPPAAEAYETIFTSLLHNSLCNFNPVDAHYGRKIHSLTNFTIINRSNEIVNPLDDRDGFALIFGKIMSENSAKYIKVQVAFTDFEFSYGNEKIEEINKGMLLCDIEKKLWFKLEEPSTDYREIGEELNAYLDTKSPLLFKYNKNHKFHFSYRKLSEFRAHDYEGKLVKDGIILNPASQSPKKWLSLSGTFPDGDLLIRTFVDDYYFDMGQTENQNVSLYYRGVDQFWYKLEYAKGCQMQPFHCILNDYNFPSDEGQIWRRIREYLLVDTNGKFWPLVKNDFKEGAVMVRGKLVPPAENESLPELKIQGYVERYSIDFGQSLDDENKGLWICDIHDYWYKIATPADPSYQTMADVGITASKKFLQLYDTLMYSENPEFLDYDENEQKYFCKYGILEVYEKSNQSFDIRFVFNNKKFVFDNLDTIIDYDQSKKFERSINALTGKSKVSFNLVCLILYCCLSLEKSFGDSQSPKPSSSVLEDTESEEESPRVKPSSQPPKKPLSTDRGEKAAPTTTSQNQPVKRKISEIDEKASQRLPAEKSAKVSNEAPRTEKPLPEKPKPVSSSLVRSEQEVSQPTIKRKLPSLEEEDIARRTSTVDNRSHPTVIKRKSTSMEEEDVVPVNQQVRGKLCPFCHNLTKRLRCQNSRHVDGKLLFEAPLSQPIKRKSDAEDMENPELKKQRRDDFSRPFDQRDDFSRSYDNRDAYSRPIDRREDDYSRYNDRRDEGFSRSVARHDEPMRAPEKHANPVYCRYCKSLNKSPNCLNYKHRDGLPVDLGAQNSVPVSRGLPPQSNLCSYCNNLRKYDDCKNPRHQNGHFIKSDAPSTTQNGTVASKPAPAPAPDAAKTAVKLSAEEGEEEQLKSQLDIGEEKVKAKYFQHHKPTEMSADRLAAELVPLIPLGPRAKNPFQRLRESRMNQPGIFLNPLKCDPLPRTAKPAKSILKTNTKDYEALAKYNLANPDHSLPKKLLFADESGGKSLEQVITYMSSSPREDRPADQY
jgi:hypothetical protein